MAVKHFTLATVVLLLSIGAAAQINSPCATCPPAGTGLQAPEGDTPFFVESNFSWNGGHFGDVFATGDAAFGDEVSPTNPGSLGADVAGPPGGSNQGNIAPADWGPEGEDWFSGWRLDTPGSPAQQAQMRREFSNIGKPGALSALGPAGYALQAVGNLMNLMCGPIGCGLIAGLDVPFSTSWRASVGQAMAKYNTVAETTIKSGSYYGPFGGQNGNHFIPELWDLSRGNGSVSGQAGDALIEWTTPGNRLTIQQIIRSKSDLAGYFIDKADRTANYKWALGIEYPMKNNPGLSFPHYLLPPE